VKTPGLWPDELDVRDPFAEVCPLGDFEALWREVDTTGQGQDTLAERAAALGLDQELLPEATSPPLADRVPELAAIVRLGTDIDPALGASAPDLVLGPWGLSADPHTRAVAVAWGALHPMDEPPPSAIERWLRQRGGERWLRNSLSALRNTPPAPYRVISWAPDASGAGTATLVPLLELGACAHTGPVRVERPGTVAGPVRPGGGLLARVVQVRGEPGWVAVGALAVAEPVLPSHWLIRATWKARSAGLPARTIPDVLRARGPHLVRRMLEREWP
jgi:hypothetical protein